MAGDASISLQQVFKILEQKGWSPVVGDASRLFKRKLGEGFLKVTDAHVETYGDVPTLRQSHAEFIADNVRHLIRT